MLPPSVEAGGNSAEPLRPGQHLNFPPRSHWPREARGYEDTVPLHEDKGAVTQPLHERQAMLLEVTSDLIRASAPDELGRMTFERVSSAFGADICFNYRLDPPGHRLSLLFAPRIPPEQLEAAQSLELGQVFCGTAAAARAAVVAATQH